MHYRITVNDALLYIVVVSSVHLGKKIVVQFILNDRRENETHLCGLMTMVMTIAKATTTTISTIVTTIITTITTIEECPTNYRRKLSYIFQMDI